MRREAGLTAALAFALSGCSLGLSSSRREGDYRVVTKKECFWAPHTDRAQCKAPNSAFFPYLRSRCANGPLAWLFMLPLDVVASPLVYAMGRECRDGATKTTYIEPSSAAKRRREAERTAQRAREAEEETRLAALRAEQDRLAAEYPEPGAAPRASARPDDYALVVGIEGYRSVPKADYAEADAKAARRYLEGLGVPPSNIVLLSGAGASRADLTKYLEEWLPGVVQPDSRVYFYYSGHGAPDPQTGAAYLVPWDGDPAFPKSTAYPLAEVYRRLGALPAKESVALIDACFSGTGGRSVLAPGIRPLVIVEDLGAPPPKVSILSASGGREIAGSIESRRSGLFTYFLLRGLSGEADADKDGHVTLGEAHGFVKDRVRDAARRSNRDQNPRLLGDAALRLY